MPLAEISQRCEQSCLLLESLAIADEIDLRSLNIDESVIL
jgi:hypothetical protein